MNNIKKHFCIVCTGGAQGFPFAETTISGYRCSSKSESLSQPLFKLEFQFCNKCGMVFYPLTDTAKPLLDRLYREHVSTYYHTNQLTQYMDAFVGDNVIRYNLNSEMCILEIGCNSGRLLTMFNKKSGCKIYGVEPSKTFSQEWDARGIPVVNEYFDENTVAVLQNHIFDLIIVRHVFEHVPDPVRFFKNLALLSSKATTVIIEVPYFKTVLERGRIENVGYSHLNYYTLKSLSAIAEICGLSISYYELVDTDGGSIVVHFKKYAPVNQRFLLDEISENDFNKFSRKLEEAQLRVRKFLDRYHKNEIVGFGAGSKGPHLINILGLKDKIDYVIDETPEYQGKFLPGTSIQITDMSIIKNNKIQAVLNLAPTHSQAIRAKFDNRIEFFEVI